MSKDFYEAIKGRRSVYAIGRETVASDERIREIVEFAVKETPTSFNVQSGRAVVLLGKEHERLWEIAEEALRKVVPAESFAPTKEKLDAFRAGYGTVLFYEDQTGIEALQKQFALYKDNFPLWSLQSSGMLQLIVWTALTEEGFGATLQHYNPLIDEAVRAEWNIPASWKLWGEMPFGSVKAPADAKDVLPVDQRVRFFKK